MFAVIVNGQEYSTCSMQWNTTVMSILKHRSEGKQCSLRELPFRTPSVMPQKMLRGDHARIPGSSKKVLLILGCACIYLCMSGMYCHVY